MLVIKPIPAFNDNYIWAIINDSSHCLIVDPGDAQPVISFLSKRQLALQAILVTHHHFDHINGIPELVKHYQCPVFGPNDHRIPNITDPLEENDTLPCKLFDINFKILEVPGHTTTHIAYYDKDILFIGDTLFSSGCGRLFEGSPEQMYASIQKIKALPPSTKMYCTHEYTLDNIKFAKVIEPNNQDLLNREKEVVQLRKLNQPTLPTTLTDELKFNPFLRTNHASVQESVAKQYNLNSNNPITIFSALRDWKDNF